MRLVCKGEMQPSRQKLRPQTASSKANISGLNQWFRSARTYAIKSWRSSLEARRRRERALEERIAKTPLKLIINVYFGVVMFGGCFILSAVFAITWTRLFWPVALGHGIFTGWMVHELIKRKDASKQAYRRSHGLCANCGYDLRGSPDRCPECGTKPVPPLKHK